jgi:predicted hydrocarbon binding protein
MIDKEKVLEGYEGLTPVEAGADSHLLGDEEGLMKFGIVKLTNLPVDAYNQAAFDWKTALREKLGRDVASNLLINTGHECGYNTLSAIYLSDPFQEAIDPMCDDKEDLAHALALAPRAFGMGRYRLVDVSEEELKLRSYGCPEANYYLENNDSHAENPVCHMQTGILTAIANVVYRGDARDHREKVYENEPDVFHPDAYYGKETKCRAAGDPYCEFVVRKEFNSNNDEEPPEEYR